MKLNPDTKDAILFLGGCVGMTLHGLALPLLTGHGSIQWFLAFAGLAGVGVAGAARSRNGS